jgi:peptidoglycan hydrolase-like protein with peptidoglycan-binding domain
VTLLQRALARLGYSPGTADGKYGPKTKEAVTRLQQAAGLGTDGIFGRRTLAALTQRLDNA